MTFSWKPIPIGAGGFITGMSIANDGTIVIKTDVAGGYRWYPNDNSYPRGNAGGSGTWKQLCVAQAMPGNDPIVSTGWGIVELQIAPSDSNVLYMWWPIGDQST